MRLVTITAVKVGEAETKVSALSSFSGREHTLILPLSLFDFTQAYIEWENGALIHTAFPTLSAIQREFLMTGVTQDEWNKEFPDD